MIAFILFAAFLEPEAARRVEAQLLIDDRASALHEAEEFAKAYPYSRIAGLCLIETLAANGFEERALDALEHFALKHPDLPTDRGLLEAIAWGALQRGIDSNQYGVRLAALVGSYLTRDAKTVPILIRMMRDSNAVVRSIAVQLCTSYGDAVLKEEIARLLSEEKVWMVRLEAMRAAGQLRMKNLAPKLRSIVQDEKTTYEEKTLAIEALVSIYDTATLEQVAALSKSNRAGLRHLACSLAAHFQITGVKEILLSLTADAHPDVRVAALNAIGLSYLKEIPRDELKASVGVALQDSNPAVSITAGWLALLIDPLFGEPSLAKWLSDPFSEYRRLAAGAVATSGKQGTALALRTLDKSQDPYVNANLALGLIGQRCEVKRCSDILFHFLETEKRMWMWDERANPLFRVLAPSQVRYNDQIPSYPEAIDQMTRLNLVTLLSVVEDPRALQALKTFLQRKSWGLTGVAAATLLQEGDETALELIRGLVDDEEPNVRLQACLVLAMLGKDESVLQDLQDAYYTVDHDHKLHILEALGHIGSEESSPFLLKVLREPFPILRAAAAAALIQSLNR